MGELVKQGEDLVFSAAGVCRWWCVYLQNTLCLEERFEFSVPERDDLCETK